MIERPQYSWFALAKDPGSQIRSSMPSLRRLEVAKRAGVGAVASATTNDKEVLRRCPSNGGTRS
jgi:hypothetical protein